MCKFLRSMIVMVVLLVFPAVSFAENQTGISKVSPLDIDIWVNKGDQATYYFGEDVAVYFRTSADCYVVVYDIDPAGNVSLLYPAEYESDCFVRGGEVYRIPDPSDDYRLEITGPRGREFIHAVASYDYIEPPEFIRYEFYEYGDWDYYYDDFIHTMHGEMADFVARLNDRIVNGPYVTASTMFYIDDSYRHHRWYRYWPIEPYYVSSVWIGCNFPYAEVWIDGCYYGIAPILIPSIYIGHHWVWIYYNGYPCWQDYIYIRHGQRYYVDAKIKRRFGDFDYGRSKMKHWSFKQDKHRNEPDFIRDVVKHPVEHPKRLKQPPSRVTQKYSKKHDIRQVESPKRPDKTLNKELKPQRDKISSDKPKRNAVIDKKPDTGISRKPKGDSKKVIRNEGIDKRFQQPTEIKRSDAKTKREVRTISRPVEERQIGVKKSGRIQKSTPKSSNRSISTPSVKRDVSKSTSRTSGKRGKR
jgi:hypothetical protein